MTQNTSQQKDFQNIIGNLLRYGVWSSLALTFTGGIVYLFHHSKDIEDYSVYIEKEQNIFEIIRSVYEGVLTGKGYSIIHLGIILLFLTPVFRILLSLFSFIREKDYLYIIITSIVISIIILSISFGFSH
jgi:uncharacterized membrane protein